MNNNYLLLTPGPLTTSRRVKEAMLKDSCTWDDDYNLGVIQVIRRQLVELAGGEQGYTAVLMQGSGTFAVESVLQTVIGLQHKLLIINNGAYGARIVEMAKRLGLSYHEIDCGEVSQPDLLVMEQILQQQSDITHIAMVHCETTTGILNPLTEVAELSQRYHKSLIIDAMSSFGGIPINVTNLGIDFLISSANKCIQGVPGFGFVIAREDKLAECANRCRSLSLDLYDQWLCMEQGQGKWRFTSPTHAVLAFAQALKELEEEGGISDRNQRYCQNQRKLVSGMRKLGFDTLLDDSLQSPIITAFYSPKHQDYKFKHFYTLLKDQGFVIYPGKVSQSDCFRIGNIGEVYSRDIEALLSAVTSSCYWQIKQPTY
ncbi:2-aminoethylphosphonate--pyruvate transaminase [Budvicia aquatica]|uniref:2-aminoethylphosphonate--pyruvate transaminase n=1 Tax=Budvicia aquatica TaxID=82979 RepID=UPI0020885E8C|nr:2-aminoethylphosphonate--pyruvate transaminase [Budvicia aquatica]GKX52979.1 2-aminoethylphosphonate--pyruvate transaminase [Budvicia aquatica]